MLMMLFLLCFIALIVGLIKPSLIIRWGDEEQKTRKKVFGIFLLAFVMITAVGGLTHKLENKKEVAQKNVEEKAEINNNASSDGSADPRVKNEDGSTTVKLNNGYLTEYPDGTTISVTGKFKTETKGAYKALDIEKNGKGMDSDTIRNILGQELRNQMSRDKYYDRERDRVLRIAKNNGFDASVDNDGDPLIQVKLYRVTDKNLQHAEWQVEIYTRSDIRKADPGLVAAEMSASIKGMIRDLPNYSKIQLNCVSNPKGENDGDLNLVTISYYKDVNAITKSTTHCQLVNGEIGTAILFDVMN